jgi:hypothetical protein
LVRHRKDKTSAPPAASDPLEFLEKLSPAQLDRLDEDTKQRYLEEKGREFWGSVTSRAMDMIRPSKIELTPEENQRLMNKVLEKFELRGRVANLEEKLAKQSHVSQSHPDIIKRRAILSQNPTLQASGLCELFDEHQVPLPKSMEEAGTWVKVYNALVYRHRIDALIARDRKMITR